MRTTVPRGTATILAATLCALCAGPALAQEPTAPQGLACTWPDGPHHLGDRVVLTVRVPIPERQYFLSGTMAPGTFWGDTRVAASGQTPPAAFPGELTLAITVQPFAIGPARLTPVPITVNSSKGPVEYLLQPPDLEVAPLLAEGDGPPPPYPPLPYPRPFPWALLVGALAALALLAVLVPWLVARARRRAATQAPAPKPQETDPERWIREEVERIFRTDAEPRVKYGLLSLRLREYLSLRTELPFPDWTTDECASGSSRTPLLGPSEREHLAKNLRLCDLAKFARYIPRRDEEERARAEVHDLLDGVRKNRDLERKEGAA